MKCPSKVGAQPDAAGKKETTNRVVGTFIVGNGARIVSLLAYLTAVLTAEVYSDKRWDRSFHELAFVQYKNKGNPDASGLCNHPDT